MTLQTDKAYDKAKEAILQRGYDSVKTQVVKKHGVQGGDDMMRSMFTFSAKYDKSAVAARPRKAR